MGNNLTQMVEVPKGYIYDFSLQKCRDIDRRAELDKAGINYLVNLISDNWAEFVDAFNINTEDLKTPKQVEEVYESIQRLINSLETNHTRTHGVSAYHFQEGCEPPRPETRLGWAEFSNLFDNGEDNSNPCWTRQLTEKGKQIINQYRNSLGYVDLDEQKKRNSEAHKKPIL